MFILLIVIFVITIVSSFIVFNLIRPNFKKTHFNLYEINKNFIDNIKELEVCGVINKKYRDINQHAYPILEIKHIDGKIIRFNLALDRSNLFNYAKENDSILKKRNELIVKIFRVKDTLFFLDYGSWINE